MALANLGRDGGGSSSGGSGLGLGSLVRGGGSEASDSDMASLVGGMSVASSGLGSAGGLQLQAMVASAVAQQMAALGTLPAAPPAAQAQVPMLPAPAGGGGGFTCLFCGADCRLQPGGQCEKARQARNLLQARDRERDSQAKAKRIEREKQAADAAKQE